MSPGAMPIGMGLDVLPAGRQAGRAYDGRDLSLRMLSLLAEGPSPLQGRAVLAAMLDGLGASHICLMGKRGHGWRVISEAAVSGFAAPRPPLAVLYIKGPARAKTVSHEGMSWVAVPRGDSIIIAVFESQPGAAADDFARIGPAAAAFLSRCAGAPGTVEGSAAVLGAVSHLTHDAVDLMTGLSTSLGAWLHSHGRGDAAFAQEEAALERTLSMLDALCREFAAIDRFATMRRGDGCAAALIASYMELLQALGMKVAKVEIQPGFSLPVPMQGVLFRALVCLAQGLLAVAARDVTAKARSLGGASIVTLSFASASVASIHRAPAIMDALEMLDMRGGQSSLKTRGDTVRIDVAFAGGTE